MPISPAIFHHMMLLLLPKRLIHWTRSSSRESGVSLKRFLSFCKWEQELPPNTYPTFVCNRIHKLQEVQDEAEKRTHSCMLSYITHLIKTKVQRSAFHGWCFLFQGPQNSKHPIPEVLNSVLSSVKKAVS